MEQTWGAKHLAVFDDEEASKWVLGVSSFNSQGRPRDRPVRSLSSLRPQVRSRTVFLVLLLIVHFVGCPAAASLRGF